MQDERRKEVRKKWKQERGKKGREIEKEGGRQKEEGKGERCTHHSVGREEGREEERYRGRGRKKEGERESKRGALTCIFRRDHAKSTAQIVPVLPHPALQVQLHFN